MKEHTYGWYPSAKNVYEDRRMGAPTPYQIEALYRYRDSKYYQPPITPPEHKSPQQPRPASVQRPPSFRPATAASSSHASKRSEPKDNLTLRARSVPIHTKYKPPPKLQLPTPLECWSTPTPEQEVASLPATVQPSSRQASSHKPVTPVATPIYLPPKAETPKATPVQAPPKSATPLVTPPPSAPKSVTSSVAAPVVIPSGQSDVVKTPTSTRSSQQHVRVQSAKLRRESATRPQRPTKSAGIVRSSPGHVATPLVQTGAVRETPKPMGTIRESPVPIKTEFDFMWPQPDIIADEDMIDRTTPISVHYLRPGAPTPPTSLRPPSSQRTPSERPSIHPSIPSPAGKPPSSKKGPLRPKAPSPYKMEQKLAHEDDIFRAETPDYDEQARKHGWMMEVHGDPLNLKKISRRLPYTVKVDEPETERDPPKIHMENLETFFLNTIPRRPMTFAIDKEWISEMIHAKRMELQKKHGINYRYKNFSFVY